MPDKNIVLRKNGLFIICILTFLTLISWFLGLTPSFWPSVPHPAATEGRLDLRGWNFEKNGIVELKGEWDFFWEQLLEPNDFLQATLPDRTGFFAIPGCWNNYATPSGTLPGKGFATFRLQVEMEAQPRPFALRLEDQATAYRLYVNGDLLMSNGEVGTSFETTRPQYVVRTNSISSGVSELDIVLQVANFHLHRGGPWRSISLGPESTVAAKQTMLWGIDFITLAILLIIGLHHILFYVLHQRDKAPLFFGIFCLLWGVHIPFWGAGGKLASLAIPSLSWNLAYKFDLLSWYASVPFLYMFISALFPKENHLYILRGVQLIAGLFILIVLISPPHVAGRTVIPYEIFSLASAVPLFWTLYLALVKKRQGAPLVVFGFTIFVLTATNDILYVMGLIYSNNFIPIGLLGLILAQSIELARRHAAVFEASEILSSKLQKTNRALSASNLELKKTNRALEENLHLKDELADQKRKKQQAELHAEKIALEKLRYQLNPHFLFNALTSIRGAVANRPGLAKSMLGKLAEFYRQTLIYGEKETTTITEALDLSRMYLEIEQVKMADYLTVAIEIEPACKDILISSMIFQPLIENAVKYGKLTSPDKLEIGICASCTPGNNVLLEVCNTGSWVEPGSIPHIHSSGIGLENLKERLKKVYKGSHLLKVETFEKLVTIRIEISQKEQ